jgi:hypothetical protein
MAKRQIDDMRRWAVKGAEAQLIELAEQAAKIYRAFPELRERGGGHLPGRAAIPNERPGVSGPRKRRKLSAAGRKAISDAAKARWAKVNAEKAATGGKKR